MSVHQPALEADLPQIVGVPFLAYVCASDEDVIAQHLEHGDGLNDQQQAVLSRVLQLAHQLLSQELALRIPVTSYPFSSADALSRLCAYVESEEMGLATALRRAAGGPVERFETEDSLQDALLTLARDFYPSLLFPRPERGAFDRNPFPIGLGQVSFEHPAKSHFIEALTDSDSEPLRAVFPSGPVDDLTSARQLMSRSGRGGSIQATFLAMSLLINAEPRTWLAGNLSLKAYLDAVRGELAAARSLASGSEVLVPACVGFQAVQVPADFLMRTPWGDLKPLNPWQKRSAPVPADIVLETPFPMAVDIRDREEGPEPNFPDERFFEPQRELEKTLNQLRLGLVLGSNSETPIAVTPTWRFLPDPLQLPAFSWGVDQSRQVSSSLEAVQIPNLEAWVRLVHERYNGKLDLPTRRLLSALTDRFHGEDGLVDAVIALESLFGTGQGEIRFRLSTALAWLLGKDMEDRATRQKAAGRLYDERSKVVHGGHLEAAGADAARKAAIGLAIEAMRALLSERPELIPDDERGRKLVLGSSSQGPE